MKKQMKKTLELIIAKNNNKLWAFISIERIYNIMNPDIDADLRILLIIKYTRRSCNNSTIGQLISPAKQDCCF